MNYTKAENIDKWVNLLQEIGYTPRDRLYKIAEYAAHDSALKTQNSPLCEQQKH